MHMKIEMADAVNAASLADRLTDAVGAERISLRRDRGEVDVRFEPGSDRVVLRVLDAVVRWLDHVGVGSAQLLLGKPTYRVAGGVAVERWRGTNAP
jgi:hypothetical protein